MNFAIPAAGMNAASTAFDTAATHMSNALHGPLSTSSSIASTAADSFDLSASVVALLQAKNDFTANVKTAAVESDIAQSTFAIFG